MSKKTVIVVCPNPLDATSFYRCAGPLTSLVKEGHIDVVFDNKLDWPTLKIADLVFFQRPGGEDAVELLKKAKDASIPVWADYDDLLVSVPKSNPNHALYSKPEVQSSVWAFLQHSEVLSVSTQFLADQFKAARTAAPVVIPNAWDDKLLPTKFDAAKPAIVWRGSATHDEDLYSIHNALPKLKDLDWNFIGQPFWLTLSQLKEYSLVPWKDIHTYYKVLEYIRASVQIAPLADNGFNRCKSNIAWIEATRVGSIVVAPDWAEWQKPGVYNYGGAKSFADLVKHAYDDLDLVKKLNALSWEYIEANLRLSNINKKRLEIIEGL